MINNIEKVLERGERIELLVERTGELSTDAVSFKKKSTSLKNALWWQNKKIIIAIIALIVLVIVVIVIIICTGPVTCASTTPEPLPPTPEPQG